MMIGEGRRAKAKDEDAPPRGGGGLLSTAC